MPIGKYFKGDGETVAADMQKRYGKDWKRVFYATANARKMTPAGPSKGAIAVLSGKKA